ncbi:MAG: large-conductance mechanosensitive channel protein MscL, partial [Bacteroidales bacterium]|nr:large-conductance mechanosensitive channel protein MscL [Bacteroidales bacterium]
AVGVIIGSAFGKIVSSLVADIIMPPIGVLLGGVHFSELSFTLKKPVIENGVEIAKAATLNYGNFLQITLDFLIISFCIFMFVKGINTLRKKPESVKPAEPSNEEKLLKEIRDILKENKNNSQQ